jgi:hypothetical protein
MHWQAFWKMIERDCQQADWQSVPSVSIPEGTPALVYEYSSKEFATINFPAPTPESVWDAIHRGDDMGRRLFEGQWKVEGGRKNYLAFSFRASPDRQREFTQEFDLGRGEEFPAFSRAIPKFMADTWQDLRPLEKVSACQRMQAGLGHVALPFVREIYVGNVREEHVIRRQFLIERVERMRIKETKTLIEVEDGLILRIIDRRDEQVILESPFLPLDSNWGRQNQEELARHASSPIGDVIREHWDESEIVEGMSRIARNQLIKDLHRQQGLSRREARREGFDRWWSARYETYDLYRQQLKERYADEIEERWQAIRQAFYASWQSRMDDQNQLPPIIMLAGSRDHESVKVIDKGA